MLTLQYRLKIDADGNLVYSFFFYIYTIIFQKNDKPHEQIEQLRDRPDFSKIIYEVDFN